MNDARLQALHLVETDEEARRFDTMLKAQEGVREHASASQPVSLLVAEFGRLVAPGGAAET